MKAKLLTVLFLSTILLGINPSSGAQFIHTIDFECTFDFEPVTTQYQHLGITFSNAIVLTAGFSLNEFNFPPNFNIWTLMIGKLFKTEQFILVWELMAIFIR